MSEFFPENIFLDGAVSERLYKHVSGLPIIDYHCHIPPKEIFEDKPFDNIGAMWLSGDHYKWRLMRACGIGEEFITGGRSWEEKFMKYVQAVSTAIGNPLYHWTHMELKKYFGINTALDEKTAPLIWREANETITETRMSPRKIIRMSRVEFIATTDDAADPLEYHRKICSAGDFECRVTPSFRTDNLITIRKPDYKNYIDKLARISGREITGLDSFLDAAIERLDRFCEAGCRFSDVGIEWFPEHVAAADEAGRTFLKAMSGKVISDDEYDGFLGFMFCFLAGEYKRRGIVMQWHLAVKRNANSVMFGEIGPDCGCDCSGDMIGVKGLAGILDRINSGPGLPKTIIYTLEPSMYHRILTISGCFRDVSLGAAWWFCDHKQGITEVLDAYSRTGHLMAFPGMLTDSRSFLSYARHDYFRRILCSFIGEKIDKGEFADNGYAGKLLDAICYGSMHEMIANGGTNNI